MDGDVPADPRRGRVWIRDDAIVAVTTGSKQVSGFSRAPEVDVGDAYVLPGFIDMHNHLAYNTLPLWCEPGRTAPWLHNKHWPTADTYTESITEPAWTYAKACPEALLAYVQVREMAGGATAAQGWPSANRGYGTMLRNIDAEKAGQSRDDLIYTSVVTKTGDALANSVRRMVEGSGFIYHCAEGQRGSRVRRDFTDLERAEGLLPTFIGIHCCGVEPADWAKWTQQPAGGVVWSPLSNIVLYAQTTLVDDVRARGVRVCLGSDWGPSGTRNLLGEMKVARIAARHFGFTLTDRDIVQMVTTNPGVLLERCWGRPIGRLVPGAFADLTVIRGHGPGDAWHRIVAATERHVELVVIDGVPRYGMAKLMRLGRIARRVRDHRARPGAPRRRCPIRAIPPRRGPGRRSSTSSRPSSATRRRRSPTRPHAPPRDSGSPPTPTLELFLDMPDTRRTGRAGPPKDPATVRIPPIPSIEHDAAYFDALDELPIQAGVLSRLRTEFGR